VLVLPLLLAACGNGTVDPPPPPTVTGTNPTSGPVAGGVQITVTGTSFIPGATVLVGGNPATNVVVQSSTTITCTTPAGVPGAHCAVQVQTQMGLGVLLGCYFYIPPPSIAQVQPIVSSTYGGMQHTLVGSGFMNNGAGANTVTVGGVPATNVDVVDDTILTFTAPAGAPGLADIVVTNANGTDDDPVGYFIPIMAAQGGGSYASWDLFAIDATTGDAFLVGPLSVGLTGMDFAPDGTLYGVTAKPRGVDRELVIVDPATATVTPVGPLTDPATGENYMAQDVCFIGDTLYGVNIPLNDKRTWRFALLTIDTATGALTSIWRDVVPPGAGLGFAADATSENVYVFPWSFEIHRLDLSVPEFVPVAPPVTGDRALLHSCATFHLGTLYVVETFGQWSEPSQLYTVDLATAVATPVGPLFAQRIGALASPVR
jgi:hypothetical protein